MEHQIERVARALYDADDDALIWDREPEVLKEEFRRYARDAMALLAHARGEISSEEQAVHIFRAA